VTAHADKTEIAGSHTFPGWALAEWADRILEQAGVGVTIVDRNGSVLFYNKWAAEHLDRKPEYLGRDVRERHHRAGCAVGEAALTPKELEVLRLLATRLSRREIGARLYVSLNTVKTHQRAVYRKLRVEDRSAAVSRARGLGLL
jgi:ATP/maltotriose-dependent transcriptional regulator MalT